jgi:tetratricopeptide (TPR) repeat protein
MNEKLKLLELLDQGLSHYGLGNKQEALALWQQVLQIDPGNKRAQEYIKFVQENWAPDKDKNSENSSPVEQPSKWDSLFVNENQGSLDTPKQPVSLASDSEVPQSQDDSKVEQSLDFDIDMSTMEVDAIQETVNDGVDVLDMVEVSVDENSAASAEPEQPVIGELDALMQGAKEMLNLDDFTGVLELVEKIFEIDPQNEEASQMRSRAEEKLTAILMSKIGDLGLVPRKQMSDDEIIWLNLDHRAGFVLSQVDGMLSFDDILAVCNLPQMEALRIFAQLIQEKVIVTD